MKNQADSLQASTKWHMNGGQPSTMLAQRSYTIFCLVFTATFICMCDYVGSS